MTTPNGNEAPKYVTLDTLAHSLGMTKRGAQSLLNSLRDEMPIRLRYGVRRQLLIHPEDVQLIRELYRATSLAGISLLPVIKLRTMMPSALRSFLLGQPNAASSGTDTPAGSRTEPQQEVAHLREDVAHLTRLMEEVLRNQAHLLRVVAPLAREKGDEGNPSPTSVRSPVAPALAPAPVSVRSEEASSPASDTARDRR
jgi:hypothetical protein